MDSLSLTTELEAVNTILSTIGEAPVNSLDGDKTADVANAVTTLREFTRTVQSEGFSWNTDYEYALARDGDNKIPIPTNALVVEVPRNRYTKYDPVVRGDFLYDAKNQTYVFPESVKLTRIVFLQPFEQMPEPARRLVTIRASLAFADRWVGAPTTHAFTQQDLLDAKRVLMRSERKAKNLNFLNGDLTIADALRYGRR